MFYTLLINLSLGSLCVQDIASGRIMDCYPIVRQGKPSTPTPTGEFTIKAVVSKPNWVDDSGENWGWDRETLGDYAFT